MCVIQGEFNVTRLFLISSQAISKKSTCTNLLLHKSNFFSNFRQMQGSKELQPRQLSISASWYGKLQCSGQNQSATENFFFSTELSFILAALAGYENIALLFAPPPPLNWAVYYHRHGQRVVPSRRHAVKTGGLEGRMNLLQAWLNFY